MDSHTYDSFRRVIVTAAIFSLVATGLLGCAQFTTSIVAEINSLTPTARVRLEKLVTPAMRIGSIATAGPSSAPDAADVTIFSMTPPATPTLNLTAPNTVLPVATVAPPVTQTVIGRSYEDRPIVAYQFGHGPETAVFVGGMHGGYEWNSILLAYEAIDYFTKHPEAVPESAALYILPAANPDGQYAATGKEGRFEVADLADDAVPGRFNGRGVDLNRNWDCRWSETAIWRDQPVNPGARAFSEPETVALRDFLLRLQPKAVIFYHSASGGVFAASCPMVYPPSRQLAGVYGGPAGYPVYDYFDSYEITGDAGGWLASQGIPAVTVELANHEDTHWEKNLPGMLAVLEHYTRPLPGPNPILPSSLLQKE